MPTELTDNFDKVYRKLLGIRDAAPQSEFLDKAMEFLQKKREHDAFTRDELVYLMELVLKGTDQWDQPGRSQPSQAMRIPSAPLIDESVSPPCDLPHPPGRRVSARRGPKRLPDLME